MKRFFPARIRAGASRWLGLGVCALLLAACEGEPPDDIPRTQSLGPNALLELRFATPGQAAVVELASVGQENVARANVEPLQVAQLDESHAVLLTQVRTGQECHACPGVMGAYFYELDAKGWRLSRSHDALLVAGVQGRLGKVGISALGGREHVATIDWGSCWQGYCGTWLVLVNLDPKEPRELGSIATGADNDAAHGACSAMNDDHADGAPRKDEDETLPHQQVCYQVDSDWKFKGRKLLVDFTGRIRDFQDEELQPVRVVSQRAVYDVQAEGVKLLEGENPVPSF